MGLASQNLLFCLFYVNHVPKKEADYNIVSFCRGNNKVFRAYMHSWKKFKTDYFLATLISSLAHAKFFIYLTPSSEPAVYANQRRRLWSPNHFLNEVNCYYISYDALTDVETTMKTTFLSFSTAEIHCRDTNDVKYVKHRKELFDALKRKKTSTARTVPVQDTEGPSSTKGILVTAATPSKGRIKKNHDKASLVGAKKDHGKATIRGSPAKSN
ncbi:unnamed protein product [Lathyrus sativus]|nr:unnamed protein product [Lathyrus sativus]